MSVPDGVAHGTRSTYNNYGCRCEACAATQRDHMAALRVRLAAQLDQDDSFIQHGTRNTYVNHGCRCPECKTANATYAREYREKA